uniref:Amine oxidase domain-containing protein n=1 Tax=Arion vulgaris TaxID=1028688 RepID=A0A0B6YAY8_9EUPU
MAKYSTSVAIIGAGVAGVTAAAWLTNSGVDDVLVLEAQNYVGGRVKGEVVDGKIIDIGAQFLHGWEGNPVYEIAHKLGRVAFPDEDYLNAHLQNTPKEFITSNGEKIPYEQVSHVLQFLYDDLEQRLLEPVEDDGTSIGASFEKVYKNFIESHSEDNVELAAALFRWHAAYHKIDNAVADLRDISAWGASKYIVLKGDRFTDIIGGMTGLLKVVLDLVPKAIIRLNTPVKEIDWSSAQKQSPNSKVLIICENGDEIEADHVIVTISSGCMQAVHKQMFHPSLPIQFQTALGHVGFGGIGKVFLKWEKPFWRIPSEDYFTSFELLWLDSHPISIKSDRCQKKTRFGKPWWYGILAVETVFDHPDMLEFWLSLDQVEIAEELSDEEVKSVCHELLSVFLKEYENIPEPVEIYRTKWLTNPYTRGTYSYLNCGIRKEDIDNLGAPLPSTENPRVLFAGEGYANGFISTFHGALQSGLDAANTVLKARGIHTSRKLVDLIGTSKK